MSKRIFVSYCHKQIDWVKEQLVPCLQAGGAEVLIDYKCFTAGKSLAGQMDAFQDQADLQLLILSPDYLNSANCTHEMNRAIDREPVSTPGCVIPVIRVTCPLPPRIAGANPLYVDLTNDKDTAQWEQLLKACGLDLGTAAPLWLHVRNALCHALERNESVNLVVAGKPKYEEMISHLHDHYYPDLAIVNLYHPATFYRQGLIKEILRACGIACEVPEPPQDLECLINKLPDDRVIRLGFIHFDYIKKHFHSDIDLFATLRYLIMDSRRLVLFAQSHEPFSQLLPDKHPLSLINIKNIILQGR
jgi:hypothetical protein